MILDLYSMVIPLNCAMYLKEKGVVQESLYYWVYPTSEGRRLAINPFIDELVRGDEVRMPQVPPNYYSAFTTDELFRVLKNNTELNIKELNFYIQYRNNCGLHFQMNDRVNIGCAIIEYREMVEEEDRSRRTGNWKRWLNADFIEDKTKKQ